jgi:gas vesicle protein
MSSAKKFGWTGFLTGFALGSAVSILFTTKGGKEFRKGFKDDFWDILKKGDEIKNLLLKKAKNIASDLIERSQKFIEASKKFSEGRYAGTIESLENEYYSIKYAINSALDNYKRNSRADSLCMEDDDLFIDFEDETLPKFIGIRRRRR